MNKKDKKKKNDIIPGTDENQELNQSGAPAGEKPGENPTEESLLETGNQQGSPGEEKEEGGDIPPKEEEEITHPVKPPKGMVRCETKTRIYSKVNGLGYPLAIEEGKVVDVSSAASKAKEFEVTKRGLSKDIPYSRELTK